MSPDDIPPPIDRADRPFPGGLLLAGAIVVVAFALVAAAWAFNAPVSGAIIAPGVVRAEAERTPVQHLEGGIVERLLVAEGERVEKGEPLVRLRDVGPRTEVERLEARYYEALATVGRLWAERDGAEASEVPERLERILAGEGKHAAAREAVEAQARLFESRRRLFRQRQRIVERRVARLEEEIAGIGGQIEAVDERLGYFAGEIADAERLYARDLMPEADLLGLKGERAKLRGRRAGLTAEIARTRQRILELDLQAAEARAARTAEASERLQDVRARAHRLSLDLVDARDVLGRREVSAPVAGRVVDLQVVGEAGVLAPGARLMDIVPTHGPMVVEARMRLEDRDAVEAGMPARVQLTALGRRDRRPIRARLATVSADRLTDPRTGTAYYRLEVHLDPRSVERQGVGVLAGMGAEVFVRTGARTPFEYLTAPITRTFDRSLNE